MTNENELKVAPADTDDLVGKISEKTKPNRKMEDIFKSDGPLSELFEHYEPRPQQTDMSTSVLGALESKKNLIIEAGTGVGKSQAYLIAAAEFLRRNPYRIIYDPVKDEDIKDMNRIVVSTGTKNLQAQLIQKDLPIVRKVYPELKFSVLYGCENFISPHRLESALEKLGQQALPDMTSGDEVQLRKIEEWFGGTTEGIRTELDFEPGSVWSEVNCQSDLCKGVCKKEDMCPYKSAKKRAFEAHVLVVNHHLLFANVASGEHFLPRREGLVVDESHHFDTVAVSFFGVEISTIRVARLFKEAKRASRDHLDGVGGYLEIMEWLEVAESELGTVFDTLLPRLLGRLDSMRIKEPVKISDSIVRTMKQVEEAMKEASRSVQGAESKAKVRAMSERIGKLANEVGVWFGQTMDDYVYQVGRRGRGFVVKANPLDVSKDLKEHFFDKGPIICTSATLSISNKLDYIKKRLGAGDAMESVLQSPFDYMTQSIVYVANDMPEMRGSGTDPTTVAMLVGRCKELLTISGGRGMILCTSYVQMRSIVTSLRLAMPEITFLAQGESVQRHEMINRLKEDPKTVLLGVDSLSTGVDIPGEALTMVIIVRMPFANPKDPLVEAKCEKLGKKSFMEYVVPDAVVKFRQAFGRLIRSARDYGCVAILDSRIVRKGYGKKFLHSLPQSPMAYDLDKVREFFDLKSRKA